MFKKVIGHDSHDSLRPSPPQPAPRSYEPISPEVPDYNAPVSRSVAAVQTRNVLSNDVEIKGTVKFSNDLVVDGKIEGEIQSDGSLTIGENARIKAEIKTAVIIVYGKIHGNLNATERVELKATAEVIGDIKTKSLAMEAGAIFIGKSTVGTPPAAAPAPALKVAAPAAPAAPVQGNLAGTTPNP